MKNIIYLLLILIISYSCDENETLILDQTRLKTFSKPQVSQPLEILYNQVNKPIEIGHQISYDANNNVVNFGGYTYTYNQNNITSITDMPNSINSQNTALITYNAQGQIDQETITFTRVSTNITKTFTRKYSYDSNGFISQILEDREEVGGFNSIIKYEIAYYSDGKIDDIVRSRSLNNGTTYFEEEVLTHFYDDKNNPFYDLLTTITENSNPNTFLQYVGFPTISLGYSVNIKLHHYAKNNLIRVEKSVFGDSPTTIASYVYTYNQDDYPITAIKTSTQQSGSTYNETYEWTYENY